MGELDKFRTVVQYEDAGFFSLLPKMVSYFESSEITEIIGVLDGLRADFALAPLPGEPSCREDLHPFNPEAHLKEGDIFRYRPLGCPITHFARVLKYEKGIATVHLVGGCVSPRVVGCNVSGFKTSLKTLKYSLQQ